MKPVMIYAKAILAIVLYYICIIISCSGTETTNECTPYTIYMPDGETPAGGTYVTIAPSEISASAGDTIISDRNGRFTIPNSLSPGKWSVLFTLPDNDTLAAWQELVINSNGDIIFHDDTLELAGSVSGIVQLYPHDKEFLRSVVIRLLGTSRAVNADSSGKFTLLQIPGGLYTLHCSVPPKLENYGELNVPFIRFNGNDTILSDTLRLPYIGFPFAEGLSASFDSLRGIVHLTWNQTASDYNAMIIRTRGSNLSFDTIAITDMNYFFDTLFSSTATGSRFSFSDTLPMSLVYRIRLCRKNLNCGDFWESVTVNCQSPIVFGTRVSVFVNSKPIEESQPLSNNSLFQTDIEFKNDRIPLRTLFLRNIENDSILGMFRFNPPVRSGKKSVTLQWNNAGEHKVQIVSLDSNDNKIVTLTDTFVLRTYTVLSAVRNLSYDYDSAVGVVHLSWSENEESEFQKYVVYRKLSGDTISKCVLSSADTCLSDTIFGRISGNQLDIKLCQPVNTEYTVVCINKNGDTGIATQTGLIGFSPPTRISSLLNFEGMDSLPGIWEYDANHDNNIDTGTLSKFGHNSTRSLCLSAVSLNDMRYQLRLTGLDSGSVYRISCWIKSTNVVQEIVQPYGGASIWVNESYAFSSPVIVDTKDWTKSTCTFTADSSDCKIWCRLGFFGNMMSGEVWFDDITIEKLN